VRELFSDFRRNEEGQVVLGDSTKGCKFCGTVEAKYAGNGRAVFYHPGVECCVPALELQIKSRQGELRTLNKKIEQHRLELGRLEEAVNAYGSSSSSAASEAKMKLEKAKAGLDKQIAFLRGEFDIFDETLGRERRMSDKEADESNLVGVRQLSAEIERLRKKLDWVRGRAA
jgi:hypothetical protein